MAHPVKVTVNNKAYEVGSGTDSSFTLNDFIRDVCGLKGTKVMCREGGCGCCVVAVTRPQDTANSKDRTRIQAINSCMIPVLACHGWNVTTTEGLGDRKSGFHAIQQRLADHNGSQCGFCSPGMVMSMYGMLANGQEISEKQLESGLDGNLCRCTGYRAILDALKSFSDKEKRSNDIEELAKNAWGSCNGCAEKCATKCKEAKQEDISVTLNDGSVFHKPYSMANLLNILSKFSDTASVRFIVGNTSTGVYKNDGPYDTYIDIKDVAEINQSTAVLNGTYTLGANASLTDTISSLKAASSEVGFEYCKDLAKHWELVASLPVRNIGSWAGNLMIKYHHNEFPSDVYLLLACVDADLSIMSVDAKEEKVPVESFIDTNMSRKLITGLVLKPKNPGSVLQTYKITPRSQNAHAYVNAAHLIRLDEKHGVMEDPRLFFGGISDIGVNYTRAVKTEKFLLNRNLSDATNVSQALSTLAKEVESCSEFRRNLCVSLMYKTILRLLGKKMPDRLRAWDVERPLMSSTHETETDENQWPLTKPMPRVTSTMQASGEAEYVNDIASKEGTLYAAFVISSQGNATLDTVDATPALKIPGVFRFISAADVPGANRIVLPFGSPDIPEPIFCEEKVYYAGQPIGLIVANSQQVANRAAKKVKVKYKDVFQPVTDLKEAIEKEMFFTNDTKLKKGDADSAIANAAHVIEGEIRTGTQQHLPIETQACYCIPTEDFMLVYPTSQWIDGIQCGVASALKTHYDKVSVEVRRLGGGFGSKIDRNNLVSVPCAVAAHVMGAPVRISLDLNVNMSMIGKRLPFLFKYRAGFSDQGILEGMDFQYFCDCGYTNTACTAGDARTSLDNVYSCENWSMRARGVQTHTPANTYCRTPCRVQAVYFTESVLEHIAHELKIDPIEIRMRNLYKVGQVTPAGEQLSYFRMEEMMQKLMKDYEVERRQAEIAEFNKNNRWRKRGLSVVPSRFPSGHSWAQYSALVSVYWQDGSVAVAHGGIEMGQGVNTKVMQVCAHTLGVPMEMISVRPSQDLATANSMVSGGSITSELCCFAAIKTCQIILERMKPVREEYPDADWKELVHKCKDKKINLVAQHMAEKSQFTTSAAEGSDCTVAYSTFGATCAEVEMDLLTGERQISRLDLLFDVGESTNPTLDVGQIEGALAMVIGFFLMEETRYDVTSGQNLSNGTWTYKVPTTKDIPANLNIKLLNWAPNPLGLVRSKAVGEPPMLMGAAVVLAFKQAIQDARRELGYHNNVTLDTPLTVEKAYQLCAPGLHTLVLSE